MQEGKAFLHSQKRMLIDLDRYRCRLIDKITYMMTIWTNMWFLNLFILELSLPSDYFRWYLEKVDEPKQKEKLMNVFRMLHAQLKKI